MRKLSDWAALVTFFITLFAYIFTGISYVNDIEKRLTAIEKSQFNFESKLDELQMKYARVYCVIRGGGKSGN